MTSSHAMLASDELSRHLEFWAEFALQDGWVEKWVEGAVFPRELVAFIARCEVLRLRNVIESGRQDGYSTMGLAEYTHRHSGTLVSIDLEIDRARAEACRDRLSRFDNIVFARGDSFELVSREVVQRRGSPLALFIDGPKGFSALSLLFATTFFPHVRLIGQHNLNWDSPEEQKFLELTRQPIHLEHFLPRPVGPIWRELERVERDFCLRAGARRPLERTSLGVAEVDVDLRRSIVRSSSRHFFLQQPLAVAALMRAHQFRGIAFLARASFWVQRQLSRTSQGNDDGD